MLFPPGPADGPQTTIELDTTGDTLPTVLWTGLVATGPADPGVGTPAPSAWQLDGPTALVSAERLRDWWSGDPEVTGTVVVANPRLRPIVWRLLALSGARPTVLAREEIRR